MSPVAMHTLSLDLTDIFVYADIAFGDRVLARGAGLSTVHVIGLFQVSERPLWISGCEFPGTLTATHISPENPLESEELEMAWNADAAATYVACGGIPLTFRSPPGWKRPSRYFISTAYRPEHVTQRCRVEMLCLRLSELPDTKASASVGLSFGKWFVKSIFGEPGFFDPEFYEVQNRYHEQTVLNAVGDREVGPGSLIPIEVGGEATRGVLELGTRLGGAGFEAVLHFPRFDCNVQNGARLSRTARFLNIFQDRLEEATGEICEISKDIAIVTSISPDETGLKNAWNA